MFNNPPTDVIIPRPFKLRMEYDAATGKKSATYLRPPHSEFISYGLHVMTEAQREDPSFDVVGYWTGMIIGIQGKQCGQEFYQFVVKIPRDYPHSPPIIRFETKLILPFIDAKGYVHVDSIPGYRWNAHHNIADLLMAIRSAMDNPNSIAASYKVRNQTYFKLLDKDQIEDNFH